MRSWGELKNVYVFSPEFIAIDFEDRSFTYRKGQDYYQTIRIEQVTGVPINSVCNISNKAEFLDNLLEILQEANIRKQLEKAPLDKLVTIRSGDKSAKCVISDRKAVEPMTKRLLKELKGQIQVVGDIEFEVLSPQLGDDYLDARRYAYQDMAVFGTAIVKLPNVYSVTFEVT